MIEIRVPARQLAQIDRLYNASTVINKETVLLVPSTTATETALYIETDAGMVEWFVGKDYAQSFIRFGYVRISKQCPYRHRKCIGEACSLYTIMHNIGDCAHVWAAVK